MKILSIFNWIIRLILFALVLVLVMDNIQTTTLNLFGIYTLHLPLIAILLIFFILGLVIGLVINLIRTIELKFKINKLTKQISNNEKIKQ